jgi:oxygen-dependent protoporphyrinogen oxidase
VHADVDTIVIGAGLSGLVTAFELQQRGVAVEVLERAPVCGGVIATKHRDGALYETGPNSAQAATPLIDPLLDALHLRDERIETTAEARTRFIVRDGKLVALPTSPPSLFRTHAFSPRAKLRLLCEPFVGRAASGADESVAAFARRRLGAEILDYAIDPFVSGVYAGDPERISLAAAFPRVYALEQKHGSLVGGGIATLRARMRGREATKRGSFSFRTGMQTLTDALTDTLERVANDVEVERVDRDRNGGWTISYEKNGERVARTSKSVVLATPAFAAATLVRDVAGGASEVLERIAYAPIAIAVTLYRRADIEHSLHGFGFLVPAKEKRSILGSLFSSSMFDGRAPAGSVLLTTFIGGSRNPTLVARSDAELARLAHDELRELVGARSEPRWSEVVRWDKAIPQYEVGHLDRIRVIEESERGLPGLYFCANYRGGVSIGNCIESAHLTAERVGSFLRIDAVDRAESEFGERV